MSTFELTNLTDQWLTPDYILAPLGEFDLDPCAYPAYRTRCAKLGYALPEENGLLLPWEGRVWCNPPYGRETRKWTQKMALHGNGVMLVKAAPETAWYRDLWEYASALYFPYHRIAFFDEQLTKSKGSKISNVVAAFGDNNIGSLEALKAAVPGALVTRWMA